MQVWAEGKLEVLVNNNRLRLFKLIFDVNIDLSLEIVPFRLLPSIQDQLLDLVTISQL
jgi:hypothetical protein